ncbi:response regulator transcription factor [Massilia sp. TN1-12]|uniref:response regulator transcription factor n=1 Tax=Massilia paldalensis TaxID=3377675 RepID=UPI00384E7454
MRQQEPGQAIVVSTDIQEPLLQAGVRAALEREPGIRVVEGAPGVAVDATVDVAVVDGERAFALAEAGLPRGAAGRRVLAVTRTAPIDAVRAALRQGVHGFVLSTAPLHELADAVRTLARGGNYLCQTLTWEMATGPSDDMLTRREVEVLQLLVQGACNKSIARDLGIAVGTVKWHVRAIMMKLDASTRTQAASIALSRGLLDAAGFAGGAAAARSRAAA